MVSKFDNGGTRQVCIVKQEDGAGLHQDETYQQKMKEVFDQKDWLLFDQPSQSSVTNVHDACVFPMMSKAVSSTQAVNFGSRLLKGEELNQTVMKVWEEKGHLPAISRAFVAHHQIVSCIIQHDGDNKYLSERGGMSFGVRRMYMTDEEGEGVIPVPLAMVEGETLQAQLINEKRSRELKYEEPAMGDLTQARMTNEMKSFLMANMDGERIDNELAEYWLSDMEDNRDLEEEDGRDVGVRG